MAAFALTYGYLSVSSNDLSTYVTNIELQVNGDTVDVTAMSSTAWRAFAAGLKDWMIPVTINTDVANSAVDSILWPLYQTAVAIEIRATGAAVGTSNPKWTGTAIVVPGSVFGGGVGDAAKTTFSLRGTGALTRATS
jgi:predicted secreted protein